MNDNDVAGGAKDWPIALVAIAIIAVLGAVAITGIIRYDPGQTPPIWAGVIAVLGVALGAVGALFFIRLGVRTARNEATQVLRAAIQEARTDGATRAAPSVSSRRRATEPEIRSAIVPEVVGNGHMPNAGTGRSGAGHLALLQGRSAGGADLTAARGRIVPLAVRRTPISPA